VQLVEDRDFVVVEDDLGVGHFAGVVDKEPPADRHRPPRQGRVAEDPAGDVHLVDPLVARLAVAHVPGEAAIVLDAVAVDRVFPRRAAPEIVIQRLGDRQRLAPLADRQPRLVGKADRVEDLAEMAFLKPAGHGPVARSERY